jgi:uncharacterized protein with PIN domain
MNVVDSSAWLEYFADGPNAAIFAKPIEATRSLLVPSLALFEVFKRVSQQRNATRLRCGLRMQTSRTCPERGISPNASWSEARSSPLPP